MHHGPKVGIPSETVLDFAIWFMVSSMVGARVLFILLYPNQFPTWISWFKINEGGLVFFGGFIANTFMVFWYAYRKAIDLRDLGDMIAPSLALGQLLGRVGCFMNGCCYGRKTDSIFGVVFPNITGHAARHPTQLYEAAMCCLLMLGSAWLLRKRARGEKIFPGAAWGFYLSGYAVFRFLIEFVRDDDRGGFFTPLHLSVSQIIGIIAAIFAVSWLVYCWKKWEYPLKETPGDKAL